MLLPRLFVNCVQRILLIDPQLTFSGQHVHGAQPGGNGRGRDSLSMATNVKTASVTLIYSSPSRDRRQASTRNFIEVLPVETRSA